MKQLIENGTGRVILDDVVEWSDTHVKTADGIEGSGHPFDGATLYEDGVKIYPLTADEQQAAKLATFTDELKQIASSYRATLCRNFGAGAETNPAITAAYVTSYFDGKRLAGTITPLETADAVALIRDFAILSAWTGDDTTWSIPWDIVP